MCAGGIATDVTNRIPPYTNCASVANNFIGGYDISYGQPRGGVMHRPATGRGRPAGIQDGHHGRD
jgi:hypothetical protein